MDKGSRGGKHSNNIITAESQRNNRVTNVESQPAGHSTYKFYDAKLGPRTITGMNREDVLRKARNLGYSEDDLVKGERG